MYRKLLITAAALLSGVLQAYAQLVPQHTDYALMLSGKYYDGTARSVAMGNAMTALGGDLGALSYNPAASGVYRYSEITLTPSVYSTSVSTSLLDGQDRYGISRFSLSNAGWVGTFDTGRSRGLLNFNFAITANQSNNLAYRSSARGLQSSSSYLGSLAYHMPAISGSDMTMPEEFPDRPFFYSDAAWNQVLAWNTGMIDSIAGGQGFVGATENITDDGRFVIPGTLIQDYYKERTGYVEDIIINASGNVSNIFFFGVSLTLQSIWANEYTSITETAGDPSLFQTGFTDFTKEYRLTTSGMGVNASAGFIVRPVAGLTIGGSISTPTWMFLNESWMESMSGNTGLYGAAALDSPVGEYAYRVTSPFRWNIGVGYTVGGFLAIGVDYERTDYSNIFMAEDNGSRSGFSAENDFMSSYYRAVNNVRAGIEAWPHPQLAVRLGYNYYSSPYRTGAASPFSNYESDMHYASAGLGFRAASGFFIDMAYQQQCNPGKLDFLLYDSYENSPAPSVSESWRSWKLLLTLGWRF